MFNSGIRGRRAKDGEGTVSTQSGFVQKSDPQPTISSYTISGIDDTALDTAGGQTVVVIGTGFATGISGTLGGTQLGAVTFVSPTQVTFTSPAKSAGSHSLVLYNSTGGAAILVPGITYSSVPTYTTAAGSIGTVYETKSINTSVVATSDSSITYSLDSGTLPAGATLSSNGTITGTAPVDAASTTYTFSVKATDAELQDVTRTFTLTVNTDVVTWVTPANGSTITLDGTAYSQALSATDAAGYSVSYSANSLPTGLTLSSGTISGSPTAEGTSTSALTATASTTTRTSTNTITWVVVLGDPFWKSVTLLLNGNTPATTFINDASLNNAQLTINGDVRPTNANPYNNGYFSNYFNGSSDYLYTAHNASLDFGTGDFTVEFWLNPSAWGSGTAGVVGKKAGDATNGWQIYRNSTQATKMSARLTQQNDFYTTSTIDVGVWTHWALVRTGTTLYWFKNGVLDATGTSSANIADTSTGMYVGFAQTWSAYGNFYISNLRVVKGTAVYTSAFPKPTAPVTSITNTQFLSCQSARFVDYSPNNIALTVAGSPTIPGLHPFSPPTSVSYYNQYSALFDGSGDYITSASSASLALASSDFTVELWYRATGRVQNYPYIIGNGLFGSGYWQICDRHQSANTKIMANVGSASASDSWLVSTTSVVEGTWYHVALVRSGATFKLYVNGVAEATNTYAGSITGASDSITIGMDGSQAISAYTGYVSNVRIVKGTAVYTSTFTPSTTPLTAIANTVLLTCQDNTIKDNSTNNFTLTPTGQAQPFTVSPFTMTTSSLSVSNLGSAYFDGTGDNLMIASNPAYSLGSGDFTIECWIYITGAQTQTYGHGVMGTYDGASNSGWHITVNKSSNAHGLDFIIANATQLQYTTYLNTNTWYHIAVTRSGTSMRQFLNGIDVGSLTYSTADNVVAPLYIGSQGASSCYFPGYISNVRVIKGTALYVGRFSPPLAPPTPVANTQLLTLQSNGGANNNGFVDQSSSNNIITRVNNTTQGTFTPYSQTGWSNYFDGTSDYLTISTTLIPTSQSSFTVEGWIYMTQNPTLSSGHIPALCGDMQGGGSLNYMSFGPVTISSVNYLGMYWYDPSGKNCYGNTPLTLNTWYHVAISVNSNVINMFVNGVLQTLTGNTLLTNRAGSAGTFTLGGFSGNTNTYKGYLSNLKVSNTALYTSAFTPSTTPLTAVNTTLLLTCQSNRFSDISPNNYTLTATGDVSVQAYSPFGGVTSVPTSYSNYFDGTGDYLSYSGTTFGTNSYTIEFWFNINNFSTAYAILSTSNANALNIRINNATTIAIDQQNVSQTTFTVPTMTTGTWYHVAVVRNASNVCTVFLNGTRSSTGTSNISTNYSAASNYVGLIGANYFPGYISNLRVLTGSALYDPTQSSITMPTSPLTAVANTQLLTCQSATMVDNSTNYFAITANGDVKPRPFNPFGTTTTTNVSYSPSVNGGSMYFDGTGDYLAVAASPTHGALGTSDFTLELWFNTMVLTGIAGASIQYIISHRLGGIVPYLFWIEANGVLKMYASTDNGSWNLQNGTTLATITTNQWYHFAYTRNGSNFKVFLNGVQVLAFTSASAFTATTNTLNIGGSASDTNAIFYGYITDVRFIKGSALYTSNFATPVTPMLSTGSVGINSYSSILLLNGTSGGIIDYHGTNDLETVGTTLLAPEDPYAGSYYSNYFTTSANITITQPALGNIFTIEMWVYPTATPSNQYYYVGGSTSGPLIGYNGATLALAHQGGWSVTSSVNPTIGQWNHIAVVREGTGTNQCKMYVNGVLSGTGTEATTFGAAQAGGTIGQGGSAVQGYISNLRITNNQALYTGAFTPATAPLTTSSVGATGANVATSLTGTVALLTCQSNKFIDNSASALTLTPSAVTVKSMNPFQQNTGKSLYFGTKTDSYQIRSTPAIANLQGDFTIECWLHPTDVSLTGTWGVVDARASGGSAAPWLMGLGSYSSGWLMTFFNGTTYNGTTRIQANVWTHCAWVRAGSTIAFYVNGIAGGTATVSGAITGGTTTVYIGTKDNGLASYGTVGYIKDLRITNGVARYTTTFTPPTVPLKNK